MSTGASSVRLDPENGRCLGVCAGIANWLDVPASLVRIVFILCVIAWPPLLLGYCILYFCLDKDITPERMQDYFRNAKTADHFRRLNYRKPVYRNERDKKIAGVCAGVADYLEVSAFIVRAVTLGSLFLFGPFTFWAYVICWVVLDPDPASPGADRRARRHQRHQQRAERKAARRARRKTRKSYVNEEMQATFTDLEAEIEDAVSEVHDSLKDELDSTMGSFAGKSRPATDTGPTLSRKQCIAQFSALEQRLREIEAYMTSKRFRLHCQINRI